MALAMRRRSMAQQQQPQQQQPQRQRVCRPSHPRCLRTNAASSSSSQQAQQATTAPQQPQPQQVMLVTDETFEAEVLNSPLPVLVDFWAPHCGPCRVIGPIVEQLAAQYAGKVKVVKINTTDSPGTPFEVGVKSIPTVCIFKDGRVVGTIVGAQPKATIEAALSKAL